jgi:flagellar hook-associated protein 1 FlgK
VGAPGSLGGGSLGAAFVLRDETLPEAQAGLDALARDLVERMADPATDPSLAPGAAGLLTDAGGPLVAGAPAGLAGRVAVNALADPEDGGALWRLRDGLGAALPGPVGEGAQVDRWRVALDAPRALVPGGPMGSAVALAAGFASGMAARRLGAEEEASFATARWSALRESELAGGVDSDAEIQTLLAVEQAYAANARVVEAVNAMMQRILEI